MLDSYQLIEREITEEELSQMNAGFEQHAREHGNPSVPTRRFTIAVMEDDTFIGCASGLTNNSRHWLYLTDLFIEKEHRGKGLGAKVLHQLEQRVKETGVKAVWTWTAGYEAPGFYKRQGYTIFVEMENWYVSGHARVGLWKHLE